MKVRLAVIDLTFDSLIKVLEEKPKKKKKKMKTVLQLEGQSLICGFLGEKLLSKLLVSLVSFHLI